MTTNAVADAGTFDEVLNLETQKGKEMPESLRTNEEIQQVLHKYFPKIRDGSVEIVSLARTVGRRCLLVVRSRDQGVSAVEAFAFERGERLNALKAELGGELLTIVQWQSSPEKFIRTAFLPGEVALHSDGKQATITLHPSQRDGLMVDGDDQRVRATSELTGLVSEVTGWKISMASTENG